MVGRVLAPETPRPIGATSMVHLQVTINIFRWDCTCGTAMWIEQTGSSRTRSNKPVSSSRWPAFAIGQITAAAVARVGGSKLAVVMAMGGVKSFLITAVGICATDKQRFEQHFSCYDSPADSEQSSFSSCNFLVIQFIRVKIQSKNQLSIIWSVSAT